MMNTESDEKTETKEQITETKTFTPKTVHIIIAVIVIALLSVFIFVALSGGGERPSYFGLSDKPIEQKNLIHIFSGNYNGKSVLITVKDVKDENGKVFMIFDLKCDFVPVASGCKCVVNLLNKTYDFTSDENAVKKIPLGNGTILRSSAGKVIFKSDGFGVDKIDLLQL